DTTDTLKSFSDRISRIERLTEENSQKINKLLSSISERPETHEKPPVEHPPAPLQPKTPKNALQTKVADVDGSSVYIWAGSNQGVKEEDIFLITRDNSVIARIKINQVSNDMSRGQVISKTVTINKKTDIAERE
ncbi:MAG: hypothetical protein ABIH42_00005, partial [Planctomycetota bacterium]